MRSRKPPSPVRKSPVTQGLRTGGRSERVVSAVMQATLAELARHGYVGFRIDEVARAAEVNRTSIYRRWPGKAELVEAALRCMVPARRDRPDTGDVARDLLEMLRAAVRWVRTPQGKGLLRMVQLEEQEPELARIVKQLRAEWLRPWFDAIEAGKARGELPGSVDPRLLTEMIVAPAMNRVLQLRERVDDSVLVTLVRIGVAGARAEPATSRSTRGRRAGD